MTIVACRCRMTECQRECGMRECCRCPAGIGCVTCLAGRRNRSRNMIGICGSCIIFLMTRIAINGSGSVISFMTIRACRYGMSKGKRETCMIEGCRFPPRSRCVAGLASCGDSRSCMVWIKRRCIISLVTCITNR